MSRAYATAIGRPVNTKYQSVAFTASSARTTNAISDKVFRVALFATEDCHIRFGSGSPTAVVTDFFLPKNNLVMFPIAQGEKIAAIRNSADGTLHVSEMDA